MDKPNYIDRPPRIQPVLPFEEVEIPNPPEKELEEGYGRLIQVSLPLVTIIGYVLIGTLSGSGRNPFFLIPMALSVVASVAFSIYSYRKEQQSKGESERIYLQRLSDMNKEMHNYHDMQRRFYSYNYPDRPTVFRLVQSAHAGLEEEQRSLRKEARLWERRTTDEDFGAVRLGMGTLPSTVIYTLGGAENFENPLVREARKLAEDSRFVFDIPVIISLRQPHEEEEAEEEGDDEKKKEEEARASRTPVTHALGIAGEPGSVYEFIRAMLAHFVVFHAPQDARLFVLASRRQEWAWTDSLPHSRDDRGPLRCFTEEIKPGEVESSFDQDEEGVLEKFLEGIRKTLAQRKIQLQDRDEANRGQADPTLPLLLVVVDLLDATYDPASPLNRLESDAATSILLEEGQALGAAVIFLVPERSKVPGSCTAVVEIEKTVPATNSKLEQGLKKLHFRYAEVGVNTFRYVGEADSVARTEEMTDLARQLAELKIRESFGANLTNSVPFLDLMSYDSLRSLEKDTWRKWEESTLPKNTNWLRAKIGMMSGNKPRTLVFSAKRDGVHGMIAGSTGSGKSELLISLITALAVTYDPTVINFVLVDYKGGGAFKGLEGLPHIVDIITNLQGDGVTRMFTAIQAEMQRRQALNSQTGTKNIVEYRQRGLHESHQPYPFLFIIIDEFAEMIADRAEFKGQLESITRVGRAQGVSLLLAAQRPSGVTDQMRSNIKFRICLRVETPGESREMLRRSEAAFLPGDIPGRGYLQVGNEEIELIQVAYTGDRYVDPDQSPSTPVIWPGRGGRYDASQDQEPPELYKAIVAMLGALAERQGIEPQHAPWPDFLPASLSLSTPLISQDPAVKAVTSARYLAEIDKITLGGEPEPVLTLNPAVGKWLAGEGGWPDKLDWNEYAMRPVVGLVDHPAAARQLPLVIDLPRGHVAIFGASGWGKTTFIRSLVVSLAATHSPDHLHMYLLDLGGRNLGALGNLPQVGAVISPDEEGYEERVEQLLRELDDIVEKRKTIFNTAGVGDLYQYNQMVTRFGTGTLLSANSLSGTAPATPLPAILVALDNFVEFKETFGSEDDNVDSVLDKFIALARQAKPYGIHFVVTVNQLNALPGQLFSLMTERLTLKLSEPVEYRAIVGGQVGDIADIPGRGYIKIGYQPLSFQAAQALELREELNEPANETKELERLARHMREFMAASTHRYLEPIRVDALPRAVLFKQILARDLMRVDLDQNFLAHLKAYAVRQWQDSLEPDKADWLRVTLGVISGNRPRPLYFKAEADGVHGLIAGGTGSGKSEMLMTLIVGLALNYDPSVLNFVLVDYKGGGAFKPFEKLPHCVDLITNLNKSAVRRMFTAINAEMQRRQKLNADTGTKDIVEYRRKGLHRTLASYPHLFIIIDEYAEMITDSPEFKDELDSITRVGRAQGVNLLLASQRPIGVTDQMRANIKFRICLRVEGVDTSREMLRRSDAAFLPSGMPGRGYLQVGNENIELTQVAYTGETYREDGQERKFYEVVVQLAQQLLQAERPRTPWPPSLPVRLTLSDPLVESYLTAEDRPLLAQPGTALYCLNPAVGEWLAGRPAWRGVDWNKTAMRAVAGLIDDPYNARNLPLLVDLTKGHVALFGASGWGKTTFIRSLVASLAATHTPDEFQAHLLDLGGRNLEALQALPHVGTLIMPDERGYEERVQQLLRELNDLIDQRRRLFSEAGVSNLYEYNSLARSDDRRRIEPAILVAIDNFGEFIETFGGNNEKDDEDSPLAAFVALARQKAFGLHFVITTGRPNVLSSNLYSLFTERLTLRLSNSDDYRVVVGGEVKDVDEIPGRGFVRVGRMPLEFQVAVAVAERDELGLLRGEVQQLRRLGGQMTELGAGLWSGRAPFRIDALPKSSSYRQVVAEMWELAQDETFLDGLVAAMRRRWAVTGSAEHADWLAVTLGITSGNRKRTLHFSAKTDGVHGLVAGGTGSGKSEMLMTLIVGLALNYSPDILNFVLVDYKGGGAFKPFERLPHCVDIVTNLNKAAVNRMFTAINAEIRRRQKLNADTGTKDIVEYRRRGLHLTGEAYPHLFIIIDEYAEMISDNPEYRAELESITRVGRAQGVNLLLASQRPIGVSDQMRANIKFRICLRVEEVETSREMLRRPDAAFLPNGIPGRGYIQIGNENLELIQVSYTGESQPDERPAPVLWPERPPVEAAPAGEDMPKLFDAVVRLSSDLVGGMAPKPWPGFLPQTFSLESALYDAQQNSWFTLTTAVSNWLNNDTAGLWPGVDWRNEAMRPVLGLLDNPVEARQEPLRFALNRYHLVVLGDSGWGKTSFLRSLVVSLATTHTPDELHAYVLDLGGRSFRSLENLPHIGAVIYADEEAYEERLLRLLNKLERLADERQQILSDAGVNSLYEYNERFPDKALPAVLVVIDNIAELQENYEMLVESAVMPLVRRSLAMGITFVVSGNAPNSMPSKLYNLFGERVTFRQNNTDRYMDIVGRGAIEIDEIAGRGYIRIGRRPLLFQAALPVGLYAEPDGRDTRPEGEELARLAENMHLFLQAGARAWRHRPDPIQTLPELVPLDKMLAEAGPVGQRLQAVLGQSSNLQPALFDLKRMGPHFAVVGPPLSGKTTSLYNWVFSLACRYPPERALLVLVDLQRKFVDYGGEHRLDELPHVVATVFEVETLEELVANLKNECEALETQEGSRELFILIDNFDDLADELSNTRENKIRDATRDLTRLFRKYGTRGVHMIAAGSFSVASDLNRIVLASNYGIGLRTADSLNALRVMKIPANLRGKELAVGRGFIAKSGELTTIQVATPYGKNGHGPELEDEDEGRLEALDDWVQQITALYPGRKAAWAAPVAAPAEAGGEGDAGPPGAPGQSPRALRMMALLQKAMRREMEHLDDGNGNADLITRKVVQLELDDWNNEEMLLGLLKEVWLQDQASQGLARDMAELVLGSMDTDSILSGLEASLTEKEPEL